MAVEFKSGKFKLGMNSLEVCKIIVQQHREISEIKLIAHKAGYNWRQIYQTPRQKLEKIKESFDFSDAVSKRLYSREEFIILTLTDLPKLEKHQVWSIVSKVKCSDNTYKHISMMNFHPEDKVISQKEIIIAIKHISGNQNGVLLDSGRFFHYYGNFLINEKEWIKLMVSFLMPCIFVSPRYIGYVLHRGYCTLRLTADDKYKIKIPEVIEVIHKS
jgi:hypothetical protein